MTEGAKREMRIYQDPKFEFLCITSCGEGTTKRKKKPNKKQLRDFLEEENI